MMLVMYSSVILFTLNHLQNKTVSLNTYEGSKFMVNGLKSSSVRLDYFQRGSKNAGYEVSVQQCIV